MILQKADYLDDCTLRIYQELARTWDSRLLRSNKLQIEISEQLFKSKCIQHCTK